MEFLLKATKRSSEAKYKLGKYSIWLTLLLVGGLIAETTNANEKVVIGIHGLANKPEESILTAWWIKALNDGMKKAQCGQIDATQFEMVYWRDLRYENHDLTPEPYQPPLDNVEQSLLKSDPVVDARHVFTEFFGRAFEVADSADWIKEAKDKAMTKYVKDLGSYYTGMPVEFGEHRGEEMRIVVRDRLLDTLKSHQNKHILLVAHSMGSIIAYDVLADIEEGGLGIKIEHFVTIGSPLGLSVVKSAIHNERGNLGRKVSKPTVPNSIKSSWLNHVDPKDPVGLDVKLKGDYANPNNITFEDSLVINDYAYELGPDHPDYKSGADNVVHNSHKSYGYIRTEEFSKALCRFFQN